MPVKLLIIGINESAAQELNLVVVNTLGNMVETVKATLRNYTDYSGDMYVCFINREKEFVTKYGADKVFGVEMRPRQRFSLTLPVFQKERKLLSLITAKAALMLL